MMVRWPRGCRKNRTANATTVIVRKEMLNICVRCGDPIGYCVFTKTVFKERESPIRICRKEPRRVNIHKNASCQWPTDKKSFSIVNRVNRTELPRFSYRGAHQTSAGSADKLVCRCAARSSRLWQLLFKLVYDTVRATYLQVTREGQH